MTEVNNEDTVNFDQITVETIKEQIRENKAKLKEFNEKAENSLTEKLSEFSARGILISTIIMLISLVSVAIIDGMLSDTIFTYVPNYVSIAFICAVFASFAFILLLAISDLVYLFKNPLKSEDYKINMLNDELYKEMIEVVLGGEIVIGEVSTTWSEITIDRKTHMSKIMARFVGEDNLDIETRALVLDQTT